jgi:hypothetical protein
VAGNTDTAPENEWQPTELRTDIAHSARVYNAFLGGKDNFPADRQAAQQVTEANPGVPIAARENRRFLRRAVHTLAAEHGIRQFLDIGTGLPAVDPPHEVAQRVDPAARVLYVDNDPIVLTHARALLDSHPTGATRYLQADFHEPETILGSPQVADTLDPDRPVALLLVALLHFVPDDERAYPLVARYVDALPSGSFLILSHGTLDYATPEVRAGAVAYATSGIQTRWRTREEIARFFTGLQLLEPGLALTSQWRRDEAVDGPTPPPRDASFYAGVARKP